MEIRKQGFQKGHKINVGRKHSKKTKEKISKIHINRKITWKKKISETLKYKYKNKIINKPRTLLIKGNKINLGKHHTEETKKKIRIAKQKYFELLGPREGKNEKRILDKLEKQIRYKIIRQFPIIGYFVDGYISELNLVVEIDEEYHKRQKKKDIQRQKEIEKELNCKFLRIKDV